MDVSISTHHNTPESLIEVLQRRQPERVALIGRSRLAHAALAGDDGTFCNRVGRITDIPFSPAYIKVVGGDVCRQCDRRFYASRRGAA